MLVPKLRLHIENVSGVKRSTTKYYVWDTEKKGYLENSVFSYYDTKEECQKEIDWFESLSIVKVS